MGQCVNYSNRVDDPARCAESENLKKKLSPIQMSNTKWLLDFDWTKLQLHIYNQHLIDSFISQTFFTALYLFKSVYWPHNKERIKRGFKNHKLITYSSDHRNSEARDQAGPLNRVPAQMVTDFRDASLD